MKEIGHTFGIYEIFSYLAPGILILFSIYLYYWPNPTMDILNNHLKLVSHFSSLILFILIAYIIGITLEPINLFVFGHIIYPIFREPTKKFLRKRYYYPFPEDEIKNDEKSKYYFGFKLKKLLEKKYGAGLNVWQHFRHCESEVRAEYPQNAQIAARYDALSIMCRSISLALLLLVIVLVMNVIGGKTVFFIENVILISISIACMVILIFRAARYTFWAMREIFNTFYFMNTIDQTNRNK